MFILGVNFDGALWALCMVGFVKVSLWILEFRVLCLDFEKFILNKFLIFVNITYHNFSDLIELKANPNLPKQSF